jgi:hypothetical protein
MLPLEIREQKEAASKLRALGDSKGLQTTLQFISSNIDKYIVLTEKKIQDFCEGPFYQADLWHRAQGEKREYEATIRELRQEKVRVETELDALNQPEFEHPDNMAFMSSPFCKPQFICPITKAAMIDPVANIAGQTYERTAIEKWYKDKLTDPLSGEAIGNKTLISVVVFKQLIDEAREAFKAEAVPPPTPLR